ncbi:hypothetical protein LLG95_16650 [bacterium]|nr:hypothetical protein [bacterium]
MIKLNLFSDSRNRLHRLPRFDHLQNGKQERRIYAIKDSPILFTEAVQQTAIAQILQTIGNSPRVLPSQPELSNATRRITGVGVTDEVFHNAYFELHALTP